MFNTPFFHTALAFLMLANISAQMSEQLRADLNSGNVLLEDETLYIRKQISGGGTQTLIDGTTQKVVGICNFDKDRLAQGRAFVFNRFGIMYGTSTVAGKEGDISYNATMPTALQNAQLIVKNGGKTVIDLPIKTLTNLETSNKAADELSELLTLRHFNDVSEITIEIQFAPNVTLTSGANLHYVELFFTGVKTKRKA